MYGTLFVFSYKRRAERAVQRFVRRYELQHPKSDWTTSGLRMPYLQVCICSLKYILDLTCQQEIYRLDELAVGAMAPTGPAVPP